jgi:hypothetical protein
MTAGMPYATVPPVRAIAIPDSVAERLPGRFLPRKVSRGRKKTETADKKSSFFGNGIAFSEKRGIFCDDLFSF